MTAHDLIKKLEANGWAFERQRGSHAIYKHPTNPANLAIPQHGKQDLGKGLINSILKTAGLK